MKAPGYWFVAVCIALGCTLQAFAQAPKSPDSRSAKERLIGAWHLVHITPSGPDAAQMPLGILIYTADGHMSVQLMYPRSLNVPSNQYVLDGYEASFGSYDVNATTHTLTHHVQGANTRDQLVGKDLPRVFEFSQDGHLIIRSANPNEHWAVTWEHY